MTSYSHFLWGRVSLRSPEDLEFVNHPADMPIWIEVIDKHGEGYTVRACELEPLEEDEPVGFSSLNELSNQVHAIAISSGWYQPGESRNFGDFISNFHSEVSEAWDEYAHGHEPDELYTSETKPGIQGVGVEFADIIIRVLDSCAYYNIDIDGLVAAKCKENKARAFRHGNKRI